MFARLVVTVLLLAAACAEDFEFPEDFLFGAATASYQVEGAWNVSGKGENIWDRITHLRPDMVLDGSNGDVSCDSYHKYKEDVQLVKNIGFNMYRFSLSWSRILPTGAIDHVNEDGIRYYNDIINELLNNSITPMVTLFHWDLPQPLMDLGGIPNEVFVDYYVDYAELAFREFGDRVKLWLTFNEPVSICEEGWGLATKAPAISLPAWADYQCGHILLLAHAKAYHLYNTTFRATQNGSVGITLNSNFMQPKDLNNSADREATERAQQFMLGWYANPIFSADGNYPEEMREGIARNSLAEGLNRSRLPEFTTEEIALLKGSADFLGINHYTASEVTYIPANTTYVRSKARDGNYTASFNANWTTCLADWMRVTPWGMRGLMNWIKNTYGDIPIIITENGYPDPGELKDVNRTAYYRGYLNSLLEAIHLDNVTVLGYTAWSLLDNFEWFYGYEHHFGIHKVDFDDVNRTRTAKMSSKFFQEIISTRKVPATDPEFDDDSNTTDSSTTDSSSSTRSGFGASMVVLLCAGLVGLGLL